MIATIFFYIFSMSIIIIGLKFFAIAKLRYPVTGLILYFISFQFNIFFVRYDLALSIVLFCLAMGYSAKGNVSSYIFVTIFHKVGLAYALIDGIGSLLSNSVKNRTKILLVIVVCAGIVFVLAQESTMYKIENGIYALKLHDEIGIKFLHRIWYFLLLCLFVFWAEPESKSVQLHSSLLVGGFFYVLIGIIDMGSLERVFGLFLIYELYLLSNVKLRNRFFFLSIFLSTMGTIRSYQFYNSMYIDLYFPYETIFHTVFKHVY